MHKVLQSLIDSILLAAGAVELGSAGRSPAHTAQATSRRAAAKPPANRELPLERAIRSDPDLFAGEPALRTNVEKSRP